MIRNHELDFKELMQYAMKNGIPWKYRKEAYGFFFEFIRPNIYLNSQTCDKLTPQEETVLKMIASDREISKKEIGQKIGKSDRTVQRIISSLTSKGLLKREGSNRTGHWQYEGTV